MWLRELHIENCRLIDSLSTVWSPRVNWLIGANASGKSSILEALAILSRGRSFRTPRIQEVIRHGTKELTVAGKLCNEDNEPAEAYPLGISKTAQQTRIRINHADVAQQAELSRHLPLTLIHPGSLDITSGSRTSACPTRLDCLLSCG
ncbi:MAG: AAA family ATPase [Thiolinea sp.]